MTIEELIGVASVYFPKAGATSFKTTQGNQSTTLTVTYNASSAISINFLTPGWTRSETHTDPTGARRWKIDFIKNPNG